jgi:hypothetical protein
VKRPLPTVQRRSGRRTERPVAPRERVTAPRPLVTIGYANQVREAGQLALQLCAALAKKGVAVGALLATSNDEPIVDVSVGSFLEVGVQAAKSVQVPHHGGAEVLADAFARFSEVGLVVGLGNALPVFYRPLFSIVVTGHRRQLIPDDRQILQADLELTSPSEGVAEELARILHTRLPA